MSEQPLKSPEPENGRFTIPIEMIDEYARIVGVNAFGVYSVLCHAQATEPGIQPGTLAFRCGLTSRSVWGALKKLERHRIIAIKPGNKFVLLAVEEWTKQEGERA